MSSLKDKIQQKHDSAADAEVSGAHSGSGSTYYVKPGQYLAEINGDYTTHKDTKDGTGQMVKVQMTIKEGDYEGRSHFESYMYASSEYPDVADRRLDALLELQQALGITDTLDADELVDEMVGKRCLVTLTLEWSDYHDDYDTELTGVAPVSEGPPVGPWPDDKQPDIWEEAKDHDPDDDGPADSEEYGGQTDYDESYDDDDIPF